MCVCVCVRESVCMCIAWTVASIIVHTPHILIRIITKIEIRKTEIIYKAQKGAKSSTNIGVEIKTITIL